jgi:GMP synthase-like glutamine amidotransferase
MNLHWLQHVSFEGLGCIGPWLADRGYTATCTRLWAGDGLPHISAVDGLIVMGGPMGVYDEAAYPWLVNEKTFIRRIIAANKPVLGICLGAQLIAEVLGAAVRKNSQKEIGFFPVRGDGRILPQSFVPFHWHGDTFGIPPGAVPLASSTATANQAFVFKDDVLALQFHLETTEESLLELYRNALDEIMDGPFIQTLEQMRPFFPQLRDGNLRMFDLLNRLF